MIPESAVEKKEGIYLETYFTERFFFNLELF